MNLKFKIYYQTLQNINDICFLKKNLNKKKWKTYKSKNKKNFLIPIRIKTLYRERLMSYKKFNHFYGNFKKRQLKKQYNLLKNKMNIIDHLIVNLEKRLDIFLYRSGFFHSLFEIQQFINHKKIKINWDFITIKSFKLKIGDYVYIDNKNQLFKSELFPPYMEWNPSLNLLCIFCQPKINDFYYTFTFNKSFIIDFIK